VGKLIWRLKNKPDEEKYIENIYQDRLFKIYNKSMHKN
jgi:hypothetical protein